MTEIAQAQIREASKLADQTLSTELKSTYSLESSK